MLQRGRGRGRGRGRSGSGTGGGRSGGSDPSHSKPHAPLPERQPSVEGISGPNSTVSSSSSSSLKASMYSDGEIGNRSICNGSDCSYHDVSDSDDSDGQTGGSDSDSKTGGVESNLTDKLYCTIAQTLPYHGAMLLLFETPSGFALCSFSGVHCYLPESEDNIWAEFGDPCRAAMIVHPKEFLDLEDKSSAITDAGVDKQLVDMINKWHRPGMKLCVGKPKYKRIIESVLKIQCMCCQTVMEILWGLQQQLGSLIPGAKLKLAKEDRLPTSQGLMKFLSNCGFDVEPEMVNEEIFLTARALFDCDVEDEKNLGDLRDAGRNIRNISGIECKDWDILKLAIAVKVICFPEDELTYFHGVLAEDVVSKLKGSAHKYNGNPALVCWFMACKAAVTNHLLRIAKKKLLESLVNKAKKAYEAEQAEVCEKVSHGGSEQVAQDHMTSDSSKNHMTTGYAPVSALRRSPRLNYGKGTPHKRHKY